jgi:uncharacterized membrane protein YgcG
MDSFGVTLLSAYKRLLQSGHRYTGLDESEFSFDLAAAVHRQFEFVQHMVQHNWLKSPSATRTLARAVLRYERFWTLLTAGVGTVSPTLDIDLVWHTHQLWPAAYRAHSAKKYGGQLVDHDDTISKELGHAAFAKAGALYLERFGEVYASCMCWECEHSKTIQEENASVVLGVNMALGETKLVYEQAVRREKVRRRGLGLPDDFIYKHDDGSGSSKPKGGGSTGGGGNGGGGGGCGGGGGSGGGGCGGGGG